MSNHASRRFDISSEVLAQEIDGETVLLDLGSESYFGLNEMGTLIWRLLLKGETTESIAERIVNEFEVTEEQVFMDMEILLGQLSEAGLIAEILQ